MLYDLSYFLLLFFPLVSISHWTQKKLVSLNLETYFYESGFLVYTFSSYVLAKLKSYKKKKRQSQQARILGPPLTGHMITAVTTGQMSSREQRWTVGISTSSFLTRAVVAFKMELRSHPYQLQENSAMGQALQTIPSSETTHPRATGH